MTVNIIHYTIGLCNLLRVHESVEKSAKRVAISLYSKTKHTYTDSECAIASVCSAIRKHNGYIDMDELIERTKPWLATAPNPQKIKTLFQHPIVYIPIEYKNMIKPYADRYELRAHENFKYYCILESFFITCEETDIINDDNPIPFIHVGLMLACAARNDVVHNITIDGRILERVIQNWSLILKCLNYKNEFTKKWIHDRGKQTLINYQYHYRI